MIAVPAVAAAAGALAAERPGTLKDAPARAVVENNCGACHSLDYIPMNSPFPTAKVWQAEVTKMIRVFGAPISPADAEAITGYLTENYGSPEK